MLQSKEIIAILSDKKCLSFLEENRHESADSLVLKYGGRSDLPIKALVEILHLTNKARVKIPSWVKVNCGFTAKSLEQCSNEKVATIRSQIFQGESALDLTGGIGVDAWAMANGSFTKVIAVEADINVHELATFNMTRLNNPNIKRVLGGGMEYLKNSDEKFDLIFVDPDRRAVQNIRSFLPSEHQPNVLEYIDLLKQKSNSFYIKLSPMLDCKALQLAFNHEIQLVCISFKNEVKELGAYWSQDKVRGKRAISINANGLSSSYIFSNAVGKSSSVTDLVSKDEVIIVPDKSLVKLDVVFDFYEKHGVRSFGKSNLGVVTNGSSLGFGRKFKVLNIYPIHWNRLKKELTSQGIKRVNVIRSAFPEKTKMIRKRLKMPQGDDAFLIFTTTAESSIAILCQKTD